MEQIVRRYPEIRKRKRLALKRLLGDEMEPSLQNIECSDKVSKGKDHKTFENVRKLIFFEPFSNLFVLHKSNR